MRVFLRIGDGGYTIPWFHLTQLNVPTKYDLAGISPGDVKQAMSNTNLADKATGPVNNALSDASSVVGIAAAGSVPSVAMRVIGSTSMDVTNMANRISIVGLEPSRTQTTRAD